jgi:hypothetical protein
MSPAVKYIFRAILLLFIQYMLSTMVPLGGFITPYMYFIFILWLPFSMSRVWLMIVGAIYGLFFGYLVLSPGIHAAACVLIAYLRPFMLSVLLPREVKELNYTEPSIKSMGFAPYGVYATILVLVHHTYLIFLQWLSVGNFMHFFVKAILTSLVSIVLVGIIEAIVVRSQKTRASMNQ